MGVPKAGDGATAWEMRNDSGWRVVLAVLDDGWLANCFDIPDDPALADEWQERYMTCADDLLDVPFEQAEAVMGVLAMDGGLTASWGPGRIVLDEPLDPESNEGSRTLLRGVDAARERERDPMDEMTQQSVPVAPQTDDEHIADTATDRPVTSRGPAYLSSERPPLRVAAPKVFEAAVDLARQTDDDQTFTDEDVFRMLGYRSKSGAAKAMLNGLRRMGLVDGRSPAMRVTGVARQLVSDIPGDAARARLEAVARDDFVAAVVDHFRGRRLPDREALTEELRTEMGVHARADAVANQVATTLRSVGLVREGVVVGFEDAAASLGSPSPVAPVPGLSREVVAVLEKAVTMLPVEGEPWDEEGLERWMGLLRPGLAWAYRIPLERPRRGAVPT